MVSLDRFDTFKAVVEAGSLTAAADTLGQTRAVVSFNLKRLEEELGVTLLTRNTRQLALTDAGERYRRCLRTLDEARLARKRSNMRNSKAPCASPPPNSRWRRWCRRWKCFDATAATEYSFIDVLDPRRSDLRTVRPGDSPGPHARLQSARGAVVDIRGVCRGGAGLVERFAAGSTRWRCWSQCRRWGMAACRK
jgi:hypothetical protein